jgi:hypothetical protein
MHGETVKFIQCSLLLSAFYMFRAVIISAVHVSGGFSAHHKELIKLYVQPWVLSCFPVVHRWFGWVVTEQFQPIQHLQFYKLLMMGGKPA